jgi:hypothetical protein
MPIVFNKSVILVSDKLDDVEFSYYSTPIFTKAELADYKQYIPAEETN